MKTPFLIAEIPSGPDGHIAVTEPATPLGDDAVVGIVQRCRDQASVVRPDLISVARDSLQSTGRVGRSVLALCQVDAGRLTPEQLADVQTRLGLRLDSVGQLAQHEAVRDARGAVAPCPLLSVWADLDGLHKLPALRAETPAESETVADPSPARRYAPIAAVAALVVAALAYVAWPRSGPVTPETVDSKAAPAAGTSAAATADKGQVAPAASPDLARLRDELDRAVDQAFDFGAYKGDDSDASLKKLLWEWRDRVARLDPADGRATFQQYRKLLDSRFDASARRAAEQAVAQVAAATRSAGRPAAASVAPADRDATPATSPRALAIGAFSASVANHDRALEDLGLGLRRLFCTYEEDGPIFVDRLRAVLRDAALRGLHEIASTLLGKPGQAPPVRRWADLRVLADAVKLAFVPGSKLAAVGPPNPLLDRMNEVARLVDALEACEVYGRITVHFVGDDPTRPPGLTFTWPDGFDMGSRTIQPPSKKDRLLGAPGWRLREAKAPPPDSGKSALWYFIRTGETIDDPWIECHGKMASFFDVEIKVRGDEASDHSSNPPVTLTGATILDQLEQEGPRREEGELEWRVKWSFQRLEGANASKLNQRRPVEQLREVLRRMPAADLAPEDDDGSEPAAAEAH